MFRIERKHVNLSGTRSVQIGIGDTEVGAAGEALDAAASASYMAQEIVSKAEAEAEAKARAKAERILEEAKNEVAELMLKARDEAEESHRCAWQKGYAEGSEEGRRLYDEELADKVREDDEMLKRVLGELHEERERTYSELEEEVIALSLEVVKKIINPAEEALGGVFESLIKNALKQIAPDGKITIRVSQAEYERFFSSGSAALELESGVTVKASVLKDATLPEGGCIIDTQDETINAGLDSQLKFIKLAFEKCRI